ncbi:MAG: protein adenylyltransferase SelO [Limnohabitans sp.]
MDASHNPALPLTWRDGYARLGPTFATPWQATPMTELQWVSVNHRLAQDLGLPHDWHERPGMLDVLGNGQPLPGASTVATVYSGHQFGVWAGQLGDGRALLLGESLPPPGAALGPQEWQLKGAGRTPYSRMGDGRAVLRSSIREYLCSEAMHGLGIPTTRALSLVSSPTPVFREEPETAAVVARLAPSFLRFGHFEHFASRDNVQALEQLIDYVDAENFLALPRTQPGRERALALLDVVVQRTASLMAQWQSVGFCHGVMNTDNMSLLGLTLDYGPFQFMDGYHPGHICNHSDHHGRYAFDQQPRVAHWNLFCLGQALMPVVDDVQATVEVLNTFTARYEQAWGVQVARKLGLPASASATTLGDAFLALMARQQADHTGAWRGLSHAVRDWSGRSDDTTSFAELGHQLGADDAWDRWLSDYLQAVLQTTSSPAACGEAMRRVNPAYVLRNHLGEIAIRRAREGDFSEIETLLSLLSDPYDDRPGFDAYAAPAPPWAQSIAISCSS